MPPYDIAAEKFKMARIVTLPPVLVRIRYTLLIQKAAVRD